MVKGFICKHEGRGANPQGITEEKSNKLLYNGNNTKGL